MGRIKATQFGSDAWKEAYREIGIYFRHLWPLLVVSAVVNYGVGQVNSPVGTPIGDAGLPAGLGAEEMIAVGFLYVVQDGVAALVLLVAAACAIGLARKVQPSPHESWRAAATSAWSSRTSLIALIGLSILSQLPFLVLLASPNLLGPSLWFALPAFLGLALVAFYLFIRWSLVFPLILLEKRGNRGPAWALHRSAQLTRGNVLGIFGAGIVAILPGLLALLLVGGTIWGVLLVVQPALALSPWPTLITDVAAGLLLLPPLAVLDMRICEALRAAEPHPLTAAPAFPSSASTRP